MAPPVSQGLDTASTSSDVYHGPMTTRNARQIYDQPLTIGDLKPLAGLCTQEFQWPVYLSGESVFYVKFIYLGHNNASYLQKSQLYSKQPIDNINQGSKKFSDPRFLKIPLELICFDSENICSCGIFNETNATFRNFFKKCSHGTDILEPI